jgi:hypothetical protein
MAKITPVINNDFAPLHGVFVVGPSLTSALDIDGYRVRFEFVDDGGEPNAITKQEDTGLLLTVYNASPIGFSLDLQNFRIEEKKVNLHLAFNAIGASDPHRIIFYTFSAA